MLSCFRQVKPQDIPGVRADSVELAVKAGIQTMANAPQVGIDTLSGSPEVPPGILHGARVLAVVLHLHEMGYQWIRILPYLSPSGMHWRCAITSRDNMEADGYTLRTERPADGLVVTYSTGAEDRLFDWPDAPTMSVSELAARFLERFPRIAAAGRGQDREYTRWLAAVAGEAEKTSEPRLVYLLADFDLDPEYASRWCPPPA